MPSAKTSIVGPMDVVMEWRRAERASILVESDVDSADWRIAMSEGERCDVSRSCEKVLEWKSHR